MDDNKKKIAFIINPISGTQGKEHILKWLDEKLDKNRYMPEVIYTEWAGHAVEIAARKAKEEVFAVVAIGGDGTINEIARSLVHTKTALGIIPCGSGNGLARHLQIPMEAKKAIDIINEGLIDIIDYGKINDVPFFCTCGVGFDAFVSLQFSKAGRRGPLIYLEKTLLESLKYKPETYELEMDGSTSRYKAFLIAFGNGLFKGNLQALVGQMYDDPKYSSLRDSGFQIFYMFINIGGFFAPWIAIGVRNWWLKVNNFDYDATLPELCHQFLKEGDKMAPQAMENLTSLAEKVTLDGSHVADMGAFVNNYLDVFNRGFQYAFMAAIVAMLISLVIYLANKKRFPDPAKKVAAAKEQNTTVSKEEIKMSAAEIKQRIYALFAVFGVVIFFWLSFHQNGYSLTYFARDYVDLSVINIDLGFTQIKGAEIFQSVNPFFVVFLTPFIMWLFG